MRLFVAVRPSARAIEDLDDFLDVRRGAAGFRWTPAEQLHVTLAFVADAPEHRVDDLVERLAAAAARCASFETRLAGGGAFPEAARGRVLYAGLDLTPDAAADLDRLAVGARHAANAAGLAVDGQRFRPHLTVARCARPTGLVDWVRLLDSYRGPAWPVAETVLVASHLGEGPRRRPRHEDLAAFPLSGPEAG